MLLFRHMCCYANYTVNIDNYHKIQPYRNLNNLLSLLIAVIKEQFSTSDILLESQAATHPKNHDVPTHASMMTLPIPG